MPPITYRIDKSLGVIVEHWLGDVSARDLMRYWEVLLSDPDAMAVRRTLADLRGANIQFSGDELLSAVQAIAIPRLKGLDWKTAIVVERPVQFGVSRQYQVFAGTFSNDSIFHDPDTALAWLCAPTPETE